MTKADDYRKRVDGLTEAVKKRNKRDSAAIREKQKALSDMADNEDWLDGKPKKKEKKK